MSLLQEGDVTFEAEGVFYNPRMRLSREICVAVVRALGIADYLDALSASGVRGLRVAREGGAERILLNDVSPHAYELIQKNIVRNHLENCQACCSNANALMHKRRFQAVDLDPFGSASPFLAAGARSALSYLFITSTDTAPLCGAHLKSGIRKYLAVPVKTEYHREMGARILLGLAARELARLDKAGEPVLTHATEHYVRTYLRVRQGARRADRSLESLGYVEHCPGCGGFSALRDPRPAGACPACGSKTLLAGPLWLGSIHDKDLIVRALAESGKGSPEARRLLEACGAEEDLPMYYDHHRICRRLGITPAKADQVVKSLRDSGWKASRTHFSGLGIKTDAGIRELEGVLRTVG